MRTEIENRYPEVIAQQEAPTFLKLEIQPGSVALFLSGVLYRTAQGALILLGSTVWAPQLRMSAVLCGTRRIPPDHIPEAEHVSYNPPCSTYRRGNRFQLHD